MTFAELKELPRGARLKINTGRAVVQATVEAPAGGGQVLVRTAEKIFDQHRLLLSGTQYGIKLADESGAHSLLPVSVEQT